MSARSATGLALLVAAVIPAAAGCAGPGAAAGTAAPAALAWPAGEVRAFELTARGTQNYACRERADAPGQWAWAFIAPEAELFDAAGQPAGKHYAGPTWEAADGSKVVGKVAARADAPEPDAIPWLLLQAVEVTGSGTFQGVRGIQRLDTHGGKAPAAGCDQAAAGQAARIAYTARYAFSRAAP
jgi:hypothetical protein